MTATPTNIFYVRTGNIVASYGALIPVGRIAGRVRRGDRIIIDRDSDHYALEAWERMTNGGLKVPRLPGSPYAHAIETPTLTCAFIADFGPSEWT